MEQKRWVKRLVLNLWERKNLGSARLFHATSDEEYVSIRKAGLRQPVAIIPNGIRIPSKEMLTPRALLEERHPELVGKKWLLFFSRIHPKKGLEELVTAWGRTCGKRPDWHLIIAGPDEGGYSEKLKRMIRSKGIEGRVTLTGMLQGDMKTCALARSELFVLPTHSENFGRAIAESLAHGVPVITTKGAPWQDLVRADCGWWIDDDVNVLGATMDAVMDLSGPDRRCMGERGRELVRSKFGPEACARQMLQSYEWLVNGGVMPACIRTV